MVGQTKVASNCTRLAIIDAARQVFLRDGVAGASLEKIAAAAGLTRGAVYWHFKCKGSVFAALKADALTVLKQTVQQLMSIEADDKDPLTSLGANLSRFFAIIEQDFRLRGALEIFTLRCESIDEFSKAGFDANSIACYFKAGLQSAYLLAAGKSLLRPGLTPEILADDTSAFMAGLLHAYLLGRLPGSRQLAAEGMIITHMALRRYALEDA